MFLASPLGSSYCSNYLADKAKAQRSEINHPSPKAERDRPRTCTQVHPRPKDGLFPRTACFYARKCELRLKSPLDFLELTGEGAWTDSDPEATTGRCPELRSFPSLPFLFKSVFLLLDLDIYRKADICPQIVPAKAWSICVFSAHLN